MRGSRCKHMRALVALGLLSGRGQACMGSVRYAELFARPAASTEGGAR